MTAQEILAHLKSLEDPTAKKMLAKHGAVEPYYGVKIAELKKIQKKVKMDQKLALELYRSGVSDAMYLAGLIAVPSMFSKEELQSWAEAATWSLVSESTVPWVTAEGPYGLEMAQKWIEDPRELIATCGWSTLGSLVSLTPDDKLDLTFLSSLLERIEKTIHQAPNKVRYHMNAFVISVGCYVPALTGLAKETAGRMGKVKVDMGETACKVPEAVSYIAKVEAMGRLGVKRKGVRC